MVQVEDDRHIHDSSGSSSVPTPGIAPVPSPPPPPPPETPQPKPSPSAVLAQCLKLLRGASDEHKFAGLVMVTKHVPALTAESAAPSSGSDESQGNGVGQLRQICNAVGPAFVHRLLRTQGDSAAAAAVQSDGGGGISGLSVYQMIALGVLAAFFQDESLVPRFLPVAPALVRAVRGADAATQAQAQALCDGLACAQAIAGAPGGMDRLLRAGAAAAVVGRLCAASRDRAATLGGVKLGGANRAGGSGGGEGKDEEGRGGGGGGGVEESKAGGAGGGGRGEGVGEAKLLVRPSSEGFGAAGEASTTGGDGGGGGGGSGGGGDDPAERSEALAFAFVGRALEASGGNCLGARELTAVAGAFRDDPTPAKFAFLDLLLRWAALQEEQGSAPEGGAPWAKRGPFPAALREGLLQALHGAAADDRRDAALALLASLLRAAGQEWAVEDESDDGDNVGARSAGKGGGSAATAAAAAATGRARKRGTFVAFAVRCAAGEVRILLDEALSLFVPAAAAAAAAATVGAGGEAEEEFQEKARGAMSPAGIDPAIGVAAGIAAAASAADGGSVGGGGVGSGGDEGGSGGGGREGLPAREPLSVTAVKAIKEQRAARLLRMLPVGLGVAESTIAFLCGGGEEEEEEGGEGEGQAGGGSGRWEGLPIETLQDLQKTLVGLFGCVLDFLSEIRPWITGGGSGGVTALSGSGLAPSAADSWALQRLGLQCSRVLGVWVAEDPESLPQRFLDALPVLLALGAAEEPPDSDDEDSDDEDADGLPTASGLAAFPAAARYAAAAATLSPPPLYACNSPPRADESLHNILRAMLALSYEPAPLAAMVEEGVTARLAFLCAAGSPAIAELLGGGLGGGGSDGGAATPPLPPPEQASEAVRSPLITACGLLTNILTSAGHLAWPEKEIRPNRAAGQGRGGGGRGGGRGKAGSARVPPPREPSHPVLAHPAMGECLVSLAEVVGAAGAARRAGGGARWRLVAAHATLVVMTVARAATPGTGLGPARGLADRKTRWCDVAAHGGGGGGAGAANRGRGGGGGGDGGSSVWEGMARAVDEALGSLSLGPGRGLIGGSRDSDEEEASYEEGSIWQWCLECAMEMEASAGGAVGNAYIVSGVVPRRMLTSLIEASSDGRI